MRRIIVLFVVLLNVAACASKVNWTPHDNSSKGVYPGEAWQKAETLEQLGWSSEKLAAARAYSEKIGSAAVMIVDDGIVVDAWGDTTRRFACHSMRKSLLSALIGIHVDEGHMDLSKTLEELGIDDTEPSLTAIEKQATVADLIKARSGIYHVALGEAASMKANRPERHSFYASGYRGQRVIVLPYRNLVIVHRVDTDLGNVDIGSREIGPLLWLILDAAGETDIGDAPLLEVAEGLRVTADNLHETWGESMIWHLDGPEDQYITSYAPDGTLTLTARESGELVDTGKWWAEGDEVCRQWKELDGGKKACFYVVLDGTTLRQFDLEGISVGKVNFSRE